MLYDKLRLSHNQVSLFLLDFFLVAKFYDHMILALAHLWMEQFIISFIRQTMRYNGIFGPYTQLF